MTDGNMTLEQAILPLSVPSEAVLFALRVNGIAILPGFLDGEILQRLNVEFNRIIRSGRSLGFNVIERSEAVTVAIVRNRLPIEDYPTISEVFECSLMAKIAHAYYDGARFALNHQIYANLNQGTEEAVTELPFVPHMDKIQTLKFFVYLTDTMSENGAMGVVPGSHRVNREHRIRCLETDGDFRTVTNLVDKAETLSVEGSAGTLIIFDTDMTHTAGHVSSGHERRILRGHTRTIEELEKLRLTKEAAGVTM